MSAFDPKRTSSVALQTSDFDLERSRITQAARIMREREIFIGIKI